MTLILGVDPGSRKTGFGIINVLGNHSEYIISGVIRLPDADLPERLKVIFDSLSEIIERHCPEEMSVEQVFMGKSAGSALKLGQARGAAIVAGTFHNLSIFEYAARQIKQAVVGNGGAQKEQVQHMVKTLLRLPAIPQEDAADALAAALCHGHTQQNLIRMAGAKSMRRGRLT